MTTIEKDLSAYEADVEFPDVSGMEHLQMLMTRSASHRARQAGQRSNLSTQRHRPGRQIAILLHQMTVIAAPAPIERAHRLPAGRVQHVGIIRVPAGAATVSDSRPVDRRRERLLRRATG